MRVTHRISNQGTYGFMVNLWALSALLTLIPASTFISSHLAFQVTITGSPIFPCFPLLWRFIINPTNQCVQRELADSICIELSDMLVKNVFLSPTPALLTPVLWKWGWESTTFNKLLGWLSYSGLRLMAKVYSCSYTLSPHPGKETRLSPPALESPPLPLLQLSFKAIHCDCISL